MSGESSGAIERYISCPNAFVSLLLVCEGDATDGRMREEKVREKGVVCALIGTSHLCADSFVNSLGCLTLPLPSL